MHPIEVSHLWKRYRVNALHDSLRDAIPALLRRLSGRNGKEELGIYEFWALQDASFHVARAETLGIIGPNGAGKSTILKLLSKIIQPTRGTMRVQGRVAALIELGGGFHGDLTGAENIFLQGTMLGLSHRKVKQQFDSIAAFSDLGKFLQMPVKRYSSGMEARLGFAIAAHLFPDILLLDEVLAVGDLAFQQKCFARIAQLRKAGTTIIFISHNLEAVQTLCNRVLVLDQGQVLAEGEPAAMIRHYREAVRAGTLRYHEGALSDGDAVRIHSVALLDGQSQAVGTLETGQALRIEIGFEAKRRIAQPIFQVSLERIDGLLCHSASSQHAPEEPKELSGEGRVTVDYPGVNLLPNLYQVVVRVFEGDNPVPLATVEQGCFFQISSDHQEQGAVHLDHAWRFVHGSIP